MRSTFELLSDGLKNAADHYAVLTTRFATLDTKAQGSATVGGGLLAASVSFLGQGVFLTTLHKHAETRWCFYGLALFALATIVVSASILRGRSLFSPHRADLFMQELQDILQMPENQRTDAVILRLYWRQLDRWEIALSDLAKAVDRKARLLFGAHACIAAAAACLGAYVFLALWSI